MYKPSPLLPEAKHFYYTHAQHSLLVRVRVRKVWQECCVGLADRLRLCGSEVFGVGLVWGVVEQALLPKSQRNVRFGSVSVLTYRPADCLSFTLKFHFSFLRPNFQSYETGSLETTLGSAASPQDVCVPMSACMSLWLFTFVRACA